MKELKGRVLFGLISVSIVKTFNFEQKKEVVSFKKVTALCLELVLVGTMYGGLHTA